MNEPAQGEEAPGRLADGEEVLSTAESAADDGTHDGTHDGSDDPTDDLPADRDIALDLDPPAADTVDETAAEPDRRGGFEAARRAAAWVSPSVTGPPAGPTLAFAFNLEKVPGQGEDSDPIVRHGRDLGLVGVFDGMGGAGGTVYETPDGPRSGAYLASRVARDVVEDRMLALLDPEWNLDAPAAARDLHANVKRALGDALAGLNAPASGLRSRMLRALPTTMAMMALQRRDAEQGQWAGHLFSSGDSRVYVFDPSSGASQLTRDDLRDPGDALVNLRQDSVVSNAMSADTDFVVHHHQVLLSAPFLAVAATDGCFGYVRTPIHFEHLVLASLQESTDSGSWSSILQQRISAITGDDAAMAVLGVGATHEQFQQLFAGRTTELQERCIAPLDELEAEVGRAQQVLDDARRRHANLQTSVWATYKPHYERHLKPEETR